MACSDLDKPALLPVARWLARGGAPAWKKVVYFDFLLLPVPGWVIQAPQGPPFTHPGAFKESDSVDGHAPLLLVGLTLTEVPHMLYCLLRLFSCLGVCCAPLLTCNDKTCALSPFLLC